MYWDRILAKTIIVLLLGISNCFAQGTVINGDRSIVGSLCVGSSGAAVDRLSLCAAPVASATRALLNLSNTALSGGSTAGTYIGANPAACTGNFWDFQLADAARAKLTCAGALTVVSSTNNLSIFAATTSAQFFGVISDETGSGPIVGGTGPTITNPIIANIAPGANFTLTQNSIVPFTSVNAGAVVNTLYLNSGRVSVGTDTIPDTSFIFQSGDGTSTNMRSRFWVNSPYAVGVSRGSTGIPYYIGATASASAPDLVFSNAGGVLRATLTDAGNLILPAHSAATGVRYICADTNGQYVSQAAACVGT